MKNIVLKLSRDEANLLKRCLSAKIIALGDIVRFSDDAEIKKTYMQRIYDCDMLYFSIEESERVRSLKS